MLRNRVYYRVKPLIPQSLRTAVRQKLASRLRDSVANIWPVMPGSDEVPENWPGWPQGKKFAVVLTHDVEGVTGLQRCRDLMKLDRDYGFRSSFNFIPEGDYRVPPELRQELQRNGFEVGIHDLKHDGRLYQSKREFSRRAVSINHYLAEWNAIGFRSAFMLHNLRWLHQLDIGYDASTFDTDPFEPQPDGRHTIFPFWVPAPVAKRSEIRDQQSDHLTADGAPTRNSSKKGYVELPYTLPQDFTLFSLLGEKTIDIWRRKLDWVAEKGGMVLVDTHPDYVAFSGTPSRKDGEYPVHLYKDLLEYVRSKYHGDYWQALPREVAAYVVQTREAARARRGQAEPLVPRISSATENFGNGETSRRRLGGSLRNLRGKRVAVLLFSYYPADPRPRRAAEALAREGVLVDLICLQKNPREPRREIINGVRVFRIPVRRRRRGKVRYVTQYSAFIVRSFLRLSWLSIVRKYDAVHVHNMPDVLVISALVPKALGAKVILDLHDPMPELMMSIYNVGAEKHLVRWIKRFEKFSIGFADFVLTPNKAFRDLFISRGCPPEKIEIVMNSPESDIFRSPMPAASSRESTNGERPFKIMYHGLIAERHGLETALDAIANLRPVIPSLEFHIFGDRTPYMSNVEARVLQLGLQSCVCYHGYQPQSEIAKNIRSIDLGIIPNRRSPFTEINMPTRIFEYLAMGKPVIVPDTKGIRDYFDRDCAIFFQPNDAENLSQVILDVYRDPERTTSIVLRGQTVYQANRWETHRARLLDCVNLLLSPAPEETFN